MGYECATPQQLSATEDAKNTVSAAEESARMIADVMLDMAATLEKAQSQIGKPHTPDVGLTGRLMKDAGRYLIGSDVSVSNAFMGHPKSKCREYVNSEIGYRLGGEIAKKLNLDLSPKRDEYHCDWYATGWSTTFTARVYVLTDSELRALIYDAIKRATTPGSL